MFIISSTELLEMFVRQNYYSKNLSDIVQEVGYCLKYMAVALSAIKTQQGHDGDLCYMVAKHDLEGGFEVEC